MRAAAILAAAALAVWLLTTPRPPTSPVLAEAAPGVAMYPATPDSSPSAATDGDSGNRSGLPNGSLAALRLPFDPATGWIFSGGPHQAWRDQWIQPVALDWAPPSNATAPDAGAPGYAAPEATLAVCAGTVTRADAGRVWLDCDDGRTGALYLHQAATVTAGAVVAAGEAIGHPSCVGDDLLCNGPHIHLAIWRDGAFVSPELDGWTFAAGAAAYYGTATRADVVVPSAFECGDSTACSAAWPTGQ